MSILTEALPDGVVIDGDVFPLFTDFRRYIAFENTMLDRGLPAQEKTRAALSLYMEDVPPDTVTALEAVLDFYRCGKPERRLYGDSGKRLYDFEHDAAHIQAAFWEQYGIDLTAAGRLPKEDKRLAAEDVMHWWKFRALFDALSPETLFVKIMGWRGARIDGRMPPEEKKRLQDLKRLYALPAQARSEACDALERALMGDGVVAGLLGDG